MQSWLDFFSWPFFSSPFWQGVGGSLLGALVGGLFVLWAQTRANRAQRKRDRVTEDKTVRAVLQAFGAELKAFEKGFVKGLDDAFKNWENDPYKKQIPLNLPPVNQNYFTIYDGNGVVLGKITAIEVRQKVIGVYSQAKSLIDAVNYNNQRYLEWDRLRFGGSISPEANLAQQLMPDLIKWADETIRGRRARLVEVLPELLKNIEEYPAR
jgi:hypothetical protein